ncbi:helix-turn-helix domain-containing protein [Paludibacterium purpuratum]|nr:helix-turn-helix transcriptional regulator [Paludibacterium purpuratum]
MTETEHLVSAIKRHLKRQGMTYRDLAADIGLSEPGVKRMFASHRFTVERLVQISNLLGFTLAELAQDAMLSEKRLHMLTEAQERELVSDPRLLLVAVCVLNQWELQDIVGVYRLTEAECIERLVRLDRLGLIALLPNNRVRLQVARDFDWQPKGPIRSFFFDAGLGDFLRSDFTGRDQIIDFSHGMLTETACAAMHAEIKRLRQRFAELHLESLAVPLSKRHGIAMVVAFREWELAAFSLLRRGA